MSIKNYGKVIVTVDEHGETKCLITDFVFEGEKSIECCGNEALDWAIQVLKDKKAEFKHLKGDNYEKGI